MSLVLLIVLLLLHILEKIDCDYNFRNVETSGFGRWLPYNFETGECDHVGELDSRRVDSWVYSSVERDVCHMKSLLILLLTRRVQEV